MDEKFEAALRAAGWSRERYEAHIRELVDAAPPLPPQAVELLRAQGWGRKR